MSLNIPPFAPGAGERRRARQPCIIAVGFLIAVTGLAATSASDPQVHVQEDRGTYTVDATFGVSQPAATVVAVLTDYEGIPRFMPNVRTSTVLERLDDRIVVEQEAVARLMMFSKRLHLVLEVQQRLGTITFRDRCGSSFTRYEGSWTIANANGRTSVHYQLAARPAFDVPDFLLKRLLKRDSMRMIERLQAEIEARGRQLAARHNDANSRTAVSL